MSLELARDVHKLVLTHFVYVPDQEQFALREDWRDQSAGILSGDVIRGDCDDFAVACGSILSDRGVPLDQISLIFCAVETGGYHLVCGYDCDDTTYILDNRQHTVWDWGQLDYTWIKRRLASEKGWRLIDGD